MILKLTIRISLLHLVPILFQIAKAFSPCSFKVRYGWLSQSYDYLQTEHCFIGFWIYVEHWYWKTGNPFLLKVIHRFHHVIFDWQGDEDEVSSQSSQASSLTLFANPHWEVERDSQEGARGWRGGGPKAPPHVHGNLQIYSAVIISINAKRQRRGKGRGQGGVREFGLGAVKSLNGGTGRDRNHHEVVFWCCLELTRWDPMSKCI